MILFTFAKIFELPKKAQLMFHSLEKLLEDCGTEPEVSYLVEKEVFRKSLLTLSPPRALYLEKNDLYNDNCRQSS